MSSLLAMVSKVRFDFIRLCLERRLEGQGRGGLEGWQEEEGRGNVGREVGEGGDKGWESWNLVERR